MDPDFFNSPDAPSAMKKLKKLESDLDKATEEWGTWVDKLG